MKQVIKFDSLKEFLIFLAKKKCFLLPGCEGSEGQCYLSKLDGKIYKFINKVDVDGKPINDYDIKKIITTGDIRLVHYVLPEELYVTNDQLIGYRTKYIKDDIFLSEKLSEEMLKKLYNLDEKKLLLAYYRILKETDKLSKKKIMINDLMCNFLFTGENYYGIDTCGYKRIKKEVFRDNRSALEEAIKENFFQLLCYYNLVSSIVADELCYEPNMEIYTRKLVKLIKKNKNK